MAFGKQKDFEGFPDVGGRITSDHFSMEIKQFFGYK